MMVRSIVIVVPELLPVPAVKGGAVEYWVQEASKHLTTCVLKVSIVSRPANETGNVAIQYLSVPWTHLEQWFCTVKEKVTWRNPLRYLAKIQNVYGYARRVAKLVRPFDVVYVHNEPNILLFLKRQPDQKIVLHMHNDHLSSRVFRLLYRRALLKVDCVLCVSDYIRRRAVAAFPDLSHKFQVLLNVTEPSVFRPYGDSAYLQLRGKVDLDAGLRYVLYAGRLTEVKGVHVLINAFKRVHSKYPNTRLIVTGSSFFSGAALTPYQAQLIELAQAVKDAIVFTGYLPHADLRYLYSAADIVAFPSIWQEPFGLVMLEAMASGTCLIASEVGGVPEVVTHGVNGLLVPPNDPKALADAIDFALTHNEERAAMEHQARLDVEDRFNWEHLTKQLKKILGELK